MLSYKNFIFDLDGTLIDSAPGIELSFQYAYKSIYNDDCPKSIISYIGPPIDQVLTSINGETNLKIKSQFLNEFKEHYDKIGYKNTLLYNDVHEVLNKLYENKVKLFIATNKRIKPTKLILDYFSIYKYFLKICCPDSDEKKFKNKTDLISNLLELYKLDSNETIMIGDTMHDGVAAKDNKLDFVLVAHGYGSYEHYKYKIKNFKQLIKIL